MKYCKNCNKVFKEEASFCPECGQPLEKAIEYDIFGEPMERKETYAEKTHTEEGFVHPGSETYISRSKTIKERMSEIFAFVSIGAWMIPFYGTAICIFSLVLNLNMVKENKKRLPYLIISIVTLILSLVWIFVLLKTGVLKDLYSQILPEEPTNPPTENL